MGATLHKIIRLAGVALALTSLLVFATIVGSSWHNHGDANDSGCPYCHLGHQTAGQPETSQRIAVLIPVSSLPLPEDSELVANAAFSLTPSRAPPSA